MMNEPTRSVKAVLLPSWMAPKAVQRMAGGGWLVFFRGGLDVFVRLPARIVAGMGQLSCSFTLRNRFENGVALSRARAHHMRPTCGGVC